jgi:drug/metabolite transporter (DMT)-like permease
MSAPHTSAVSRRPVAWRAIVALFCVTLIWGCTFVWMKQGMRAAEATLGTGHASTAASLFMSLRFGLASVCMIAFVPASRGALTRDAWTGGFWIGGLLFVGFVLQMVGLAEVTPAVSAFLTSLYVLFTALLTAVIHRVRPSVALCAGVVLATMGAGLIRGRPELAFNFGELLTVGGALVFALHILATDRITKRVAPMAITLTSFAWVTVLNAGYYALVQSLPGAADPSLVRQLVVSPDFLTPLMLSSIFATALALSLMNLYQRELDPVRAAILYALEPIWAALVAIAMGMDSFDSHLWLGGALLFGGNLVAELGEQRAERRAASA